MKPMIILHPDSMSTEDIEQLRNNDICVVVSKDPSKIKFVDPIPAISQRGKIESAAIRMSRILLNRQWRDYSNSAVLEHGDFARIFVGCLTNGTPLDPAGSIEDREREYFDREKLDELQRLAREEAREERAAAKMGSKKVEPKTK